jgi:D-arabinose 1-dehydrogenase-like Zn-dependent alcohol dehydrogenase
VTAANCENPVLTGITVDGAQAEYMVADVGGVVRVPDGVPDELAAPTLCAGYTVWAALRRADVRPGARVGVVGLGGLGHLAVQYAKAAGYDVTAITRSADKQELATSLGADRAVADGEALRDAGRVDLLMHTSSSHAAVVDAMKGLRPWGKIVANGIAFDDMHIPMLDLVSNSFQVVGSAHNGFSYLAEAFDFVASGAVKPMVEVFSKERLPEAVKRVDNGDVRFKAVITY